MDTNLSDDAVRDTLRRARRVAIVGLSDRPDRPSYRVAAYLLAVGYEIVPVNPMVASVLGVASAPSIARIDGPVDIVDVFRRTEETDAVIDESIASGAGTLWLQLGIVNEPGGIRARAAGLAFVQDRCLAVEHARLIGAT